MTKGGEGTLERILDNIRLLEEIPDKKKVSATIFRAVSYTHLDVYKRQAMGITKGLNKIQVHKKVKDQQYRALSVILYIEGLQEFLEG